jgi:E3 ubiquitin-protein ligase MARCH6
MTDAPVSELSMELLLLQVILPAILDQAHIQAVVKVIVLFWAKCVGQCLSLRSYLLGENDGPLFGGFAQQRQNQANAEPANNENEGEVGEAVAAARNENVMAIAAAAQGGNDAAGMDGGLQAAHLAMLQMNTVSERPQTYKQPSFFPLRIVLLILATMATIYAVCCSLLFVPTLIGRKMMALWFGDLRVHELYTCACGVYICWGVARAGVCLFSWAATGWFIFEQKIKAFLLLMMKLTVAAFFCVGVIPLLMGLFFDILVVMPIRVSTRQTPVFFLWQSWALGVLHAKIFCALTLIGPNWWLKTVLDRVCRNGITDLDIHFLLRKLAAPVIAVLLVLLSIPYFLSFVVLAIFTGDLESQYYLFQKLYPCVISLVSLCFFFHFQVKQLQHLYMKIKNDRYLVGQMLQNFERD